MELRHLRYFAAVADDLNYRKAADRLRVAQPALSRQIKDLEEEIGVKLFDRDTGGVRLTDAGSVFLVEARLILTQAAQAIAMAREAAKGRRGSLRIGYLAPLLTGFMPESLKRFRKAYPEVEVILEEMPIADQIEAVEAGTMHVGFAVAGHSSIPASLESRPVVSSRLGGLMGRDHRLAKFPRVTLAELIREPLVCLSLKKGVSVHREMIKSILLARGHKLGPIASVEGTESFRAALESGMGVSILAEVGSLARSRDLVFKHLKDTGKDLTLEICAVWRRGESSQLVENFVRTL